MRLMILGPIAIVIMFFLLGAAFGADLPNSDITPGVTRTDLTTNQVCNTKWGKDHRNVTASMKKQAFSNYGLSGNLDRSCKTDAHGRHFEIDHLISRELGGADDVDNLWPQCYAGNWNAVKKDRLENRLHKLVCNKTLSLEEAQVTISEDWIAAYRKYIP